MYFYSFNPTESPPRYSSVILPTCDSLDYCVFRAIDTGMYIFNNIDVRCQGLQVVNAMECYASEKNANHFLRMTLRLALSGNCRTSFTMTLPMETPTSMTFGMM